MKTQILDHGYVEFIEAWGHGKDGVDLGLSFEHGEHYPVLDQDFEVGIVEAARQSTQGSFRGWNQTDCTCASNILPREQWGKALHGPICRYHPGDAKLLNTLYKHSHSTPFEFAGMVIEVQAPIFVFREWHRHRTQSYNEMSARYAPLPDLYYHADFDNVWKRAKVGQETANKQLAAVTKGIELNSRDIRMWLEEDEGLSVILEAHYQKGLAIGIPKDLARKKTPVDHYSKMRASALLRNWLSFMTLRCADGVQWETKRYAWEVANIVEKKFPRTFQLWNGAEQAKA